MYIALAIIFLILFVPQFYYWAKGRQYKSLDMGSKFFKRYSVKKNDHYEEFYLTNTDGFDLFVRLLSCDNPKGIVQLVHGVAEHTGNYMDFARFLNKNGYMVVMDDHRGHGKSISTAYPNGFMNRGQELVDDELMIARYMQEVYPHLKYCMLGHSMGSMIARLSLRDNDNLLDKLIVMGTVPVNKFAWLGVFFANIICFYLGERSESMLIDGVVGAKSFDFISYNQDNISYKENDPLRIFKFRLGYSRTLIELNKMLGKKSKYKCQNPDLKIYNMVGEDDIITKGEKGVESSLKFLKKLGYQNISSKTYDHMKHEILCETDKETVYADALEFLEK